MKKYLATFTYEYDSINLFGFKVMTEKEMDLYNDLSENIIWEFNFELGDDKELYFSDGLDLLSALDFKEISNEEFKSLSKVFEDGQFGTFIDEQYLQTLLKDEEESSIDDEDEIEADEDDDY